MGALNEQTKFNGINNNIKNIKDYAKNSALRLQIFNTMGTIISSLTDMNLPIKELTDLKNEFMPLHTMYQEVYKKYSSDENNLEVKQSLIDISRKQNTILLRFEKSVANSIIAKEKFTISPDVIIFIQKAVKQILNPVIPIEVLNGMKIIENRLSQKLNIDIRSLNNISNAFARTFVTDKSNPQLETIKGAFLTELKSKLNLDNDFNPK